MIAVQALEKRTSELKQKEAQIAMPESKVKDPTEPLYPDSRREKPRRRDAVNCNNGQEKHSRPPAFRRF